MDLPLASRVAVLNRLRAVIAFDAERPAVRGWGDLSVTEALLVDAQDPELAAVLKAQMPADLELQVLSGQWSDVAPVRLTEEQQRQQAIDAWNAAHPAIDPYEAVAATNRAVAERRRAAETELRLSAEIADRVLKAENAHRMGF